ncbi:MAG: hypothetical protein KC502_17065 [Myxococcales bacterium]|nr:hypothetical protein [Myxococcales bacterium]
MARLATAITAGLLLSSSAFAANYGTFVEIEIEEDLLDLYTSQQIDEAAFQTLRELLKEGVHLATADREELYRLPNLTYADVDSILAYRKEAGGITDPAALVVAGVVSRNKMVSIAPFLIVGSRRGRKRRGKRGRRVKTRKVSGQVKYQTTYVIGDDEAPSMALGSRIRASQAVELGGSLVVTRTRIGDVEYDPGRSALRAEAQKPQPELPKFYGQYKTPKLHLIAGTYRIGFGQRLTFDNTSQYTPNGIHVDNNIYYSQNLTGACNQSSGELGESPCAGAAGNRYMSPDYRWSERTRGVAAGLRKLKVGKGWMQLYGFGSYESHSLYQYETYNKLNCDDPLNDDDSACKSVAVYRKRSDPDEPTSTYSYETLPDLYTTTIFGGNASYFFSNRAHVGLTGYHAMVNWAANGSDVQLDFQEWSRLPYGGPFSAVGVDGAWGSGKLDVFAEVTRSIDGQPAGGGWAGLIRSTWSTKNHEFEATARYYDRDFANPYARPIAAPDEYDGLRARDEAGLRLKYVGTIGRLVFRAMGDAWVRKRQQSDDEDEPGPEKNVISALAQFRLAYRANRWLRPGLFIEYADKDVSDTGRDNCYGIAASSLLPGEPPYCQGEKLQMAAQLAIRPNSRASLSARFQYRFIDDGKEDFDNEFRTDTSAWIVGMYRPMPNLRLRARASYVFEDTTSDTYMDKIFTGYGEASLLIKKAWWLKLRYQYYEFLDKRSGTLARTPNPSHWVRFELESRF